MNKSNIRKSIIKIQIALGKILEELEFEPEVKEERIVSSSIEASIPELEIDAIKDALSKTKPSEKVEISEEELLLQIEEECGLVK